MKQKKEKLYQMSFNFSDEEMEHLEKIAKEGNYDSIPDLLKELLLGKGYEPTLINSAILDNLDLDKYEVVKMEEEYLNSDDELPFLTIEELRSPEDEASTDDVNQ